MNYLVDTHIFLWWLNDEKRLSHSVRNVLSNPDNVIYVSVVSAWEMSIKLKEKRKLRLKTTTEACFQKAGFDILDIKLPHVLQLTKLPQIHKDPFDRMLIAQAIGEKAVLITSDEKITKYNLHVLRA